MSSSVENSDMVNNDAAASGQQMAVSNPSDNPQRTRDCSPGPSLWNVYQAGLFSDMTIICGDQTFKTHRIVFCSKSKVFTAMVAGNFKEAQEPVVVNFPEDDPEVMECVIEFLYRDSYQETLKKYINNHGPQFQAKLHVQVFATAEKYNIEGLQTLSACAFELLLDNLHDSDDKNQKLAAYRRALHAVRSVYDTIHPTYGSESGYATFLPFSRAI